MRDPIMQALGEIEAAARAIDDSPYMVRVKPSTVLALIAALRAVLEEHYPVGEESDCRCCPQECACGVWEYPCVTVKALTKALGVES